MRLAYFDFGEARIVYGSAASMLLRGHEVYVIRPNNISQFTRKDIIEVEIGIDGYTEKVRTPIIEVPIKYPPESLLSRVYNHGSSLQEVVSSINPDVVIAGSNYWIVARRVAKHQKVPFVFWYTVVPGIFKLPIFIKEGAAYSRLLTAPLGFIYNLLAAKLSTYVITNDVRTREIFKKLRIRNVETIWPTYTRFLKKGAYSEFMKDKKGSDVTSWEISTDYVLSLITLEKDSHAYKIELKALNFLKNIAIRVPDVDFIVIGASIGDIENPTEYKSIKNLKLIGKIYDDSQMAELYRNATCVLSSVYIPGFTNRLFEAFFYGKAIVSTSIVDKYYEGLQQSVNIIFADDPITAARKIKNIIARDNFRKRMEENARTYYSKYFSFEKHAKDLERVIYCAVGRRGLC